MISSILVRPLINEKSMTLAKDNIYTFEVTKQANKPMLERLIKAKFKVDVLDVKIVNIAGKKKMQRSRRGYYVTSGIKKAIVRVKKGQTIGLFEQASNDQDTEEVEVKTAEGEVVAKTKEKKSLLKGTKVKIEKNQDSQDKKEIMEKEEVDNKSGKLGKRKGNVK